MQNEIEKPNQGSNAWLEFRADGVGGSDVAAVLGISPYNTAIELWREKRLWIDKRELVNRPTNFAMERGTRNEGRARAHIELLTGKAWSPDLVVDEEKPHLRVSLDGRSGDEIIEIKVPSEALVLDVEKRGVLAVPEHHMVQMLYQLRVTKTRRCLYVVYHPESEKIVHVWIDRDEKRIEEIVTAVDKFWGHVVEKTEPDSDLVDAVYYSLAKEYREITSTIALLEKKLEACKEGVLKYAKNRPLLCAGGLRITTYEVKGSVDYSKIDALSGVDLENFRKPSRTQHKITIEK